MKIRNGFVSNSSSSSFIIILPHKPTSVDEVENILWTNNVISDGFEFISEKRKLLNYNSFINESKINMTYTQFKKESSKIIYREILEQGDNNYLHAIATIKPDLGSYYENKYTLWNSNTEFETYNNLQEAIIENDIKQEELDNFDWNNHTEDEYEDLSNSISYELNEIKELIQEIEDFRQQHQGVFYTFQFSDEDGSFWSAMEHGSIFYNVPSMVESHH